MQSRLPSHPQHSNFPLRRPPRFSDADCQAKPGRWASLKVRPNRRNTPPRRRCAQIAETRRHPQVPNKPRTSGLVRNLSGQVNCRAVYFQQFCRVRLRTDEAPGYGWIDSILCTRPEGTLLQTGGWAPAREPPDAAARRAPRGQVRRRHWHGAHGQGTDGKEPGRHHRAD